MMKTAPANPRSRQSQRLSREEWLSQALDYLAQEGKAKLTIDKLVGALGVTKGSFYWHFRDRDDFQQSLVKYWDNRYTQVVAERVEQLSGSSNDRLLAIMEIVCKDDLARYDIAVRAWAAQEPTVAMLVRSVDESRLRFVRSLFAEMGFRGTELDMRARSFVTYLSLELGIFVPQTNRQRLNCLRHFHRLITSK